MDNQSDLDKLIIANKELIFQNKEIEKQAKELTISNLELKQAEANIRKLNAELELKVIKRSAQYAFISQVNQNIVHINDAEKLFRNACRLALEFGKFKMAWIGYLDNEQKRIKLIEQNGIPEDDLELFNAVPFEYDGELYHKITHEKYFLCNDVALAPETESWKLFAAKHAIKSYIVLPIKIAGNIFGTFNLYSTELNYFDAEDIKLIVEVTGDISFALDLFEKAKRHIATEAQIIKNEKRFRALIENSNEIVTLSSKEGKLFYGSPSVTKVFGYTQQEFLNKPVFDFVHPEDIDLFIKNRNTLINSFGQTIRLELRLKHKNGNWIWSESTISNRLEEDGVNAIVANFRDISDKKDVEIKEEFDKNNLNALINNTKDLMWSVDRDFKLITCNEPFTNIIKKRAGILVKKGDDVLLLDFSDKLLKRHKKYYERAFNGEVFSKIEYTELPVENWTEISYFPIIINKKVIGTACHSHDLTKIKKAEKELIKSEVFNRGVLNVLRSHIAVIEDTGKIIATNDSWKNYAKENGDQKLQYTTEGTNYFDVCQKAAMSGEKIATEVLQGMKAMVNNETDNFYIEYPCHSPEEKRWFGMNAMKFENDSTMIVIAHADITLRKKAEDERETLISDMIQRNRDLEQFTFIISHNLRAPTANIIGFTEILQDENLSQEERQIFLVNLAKSVKGLDAVIKDINTILQVKQEVNENKEIISFTSIVNQIYNSMGNAIEKRKVNIITDFEAIDEIFSLKVYMYSIFHNLISNSIKYGKPNEAPVIRIKSKIEYGNIILTFNDNGLGFDMKTKGDKVFGLYKRFHSHVEGKGMGLFMVKTQVEAIGGNITVKSEVNVGTEFTIEFKQ